MYAGKTAEAWLFGGKPSTESVRFSITAICDGNIEPIRGNGQARCRMSSLSPSTAKILSSDTTISSKTAELRHHPDSAEELTRHRMKVNRHAK
jgi:hypothetical protein